MGDSTPNKRIYVAESDLLTTELEDELVILDGESSTYYGLNETGRRIWELLQEPRTIAEIRDRIVAEYDVDRERCERDVRAVLEDLSSRGLVKAVETA